MELLLNLSFNEKILEYNNININVRSQLDEHSKARAGRYWVEI